MTTPLSPRTGARPGGLAAPAPTNQPTSQPTTPPGDAASAGPVHGTLLYIKPGVLRDSLVADFAKVRVGPKRASAMQAFVAQLENMLADSGTPSA
jgi:hypothetical protein